MIVHLTPKASSNKIEGWAKDEKGQDILRVKVIAVPEDGKANAALIKLLSKALGISQSQISLVRGAASRVKQLEVSGEVDEALRTIFPFGL